MKTKLFYTFLFCVGFLMECGGISSSENSSAADKNSLEKENLTIAVSDTVYLHKDMSCALIKK